MTKSKEEEFEELIREEVERREVRARAPTLPCPLQIVHPPTCTSANADPSPLLAQTELPAMRDELSRLSAQWEGRLWKAHEHEKQALERQRIELNGDAAAQTPHPPPPPLKFRPKYNSSIFKNTLLYDILLPK